MRRMTTLKLPLWDKVQPQGEATGRCSGEQFRSVQPSPALAVPAFRGFWESSAIKSPSGSKSSPLRPQLSWNRNSHPCCALFWIPDSQNPRAEESSCLKPLRLGIISYTARVTETESKERFRPRAMRRIAWEARIPRHVTPALTILIRFFCFTKFVVSMDVHGMGEKELWLITITINNNNNFYWFL